MHVYGTIQYSLNVVKAIQTQEKNNDVTQNNNDSMNWLWF